MITREKLAYFAKPAQLPASGGLPQIVHASKSRSAPNRFSNTTARIRVDTKAIDQTSVYMQSRGKQRFYAAHGELLFASPARSVSRAEVKYRLSGMLDCRNELALACFSTA